jgi:hypothetical protein
MKKIYLDIRYAKDCKARGYILDISRLGIASATCGKIAKNTAVEIAIRQNPPLLLKGRVVSSVSRHKRRYGYRLGIKFLFSNKSSARQIAKFVSAIEKRKKLRLELG